MKKEIIMLVEVAKKRGTTWNNFELCLSLFWLVTFPYRWLMIRFNISSGIGACILIKLLVIGWKKDTSLQCRACLDISFLILGMLYSFAYKSSPSNTWLIELRWTLIWCVLPVWSIIFKIE